MSSAAKTTLTVLLGIPAFMVAALLFSPLILLAGYGFDAAIGYKTGCSMNTLAAAVGGWSALAQTTALAGRWLIGLASITVSMFWVMGLVLMNMCANEIAHKRALSYVKYSTATLIALAALIPLYSQGICLAT